MLPRRRIHPYWLMGGLWLSIATASIVAMHHVFTTENSSTTSAIIFINFLCLASPAFHLLKGGDIGGRDAIIIAFAPFAGILINIITLMLFNFATASVVHWPAWLFIIGLVVMFWPILIGIIVYQGFVGE